MLPRRGRDGRTSDGVMPSTATAASDRYRHEWTSPVNWVNGSELGYRRRSHSVR